MLNVLLFSVKMAQESQQLRVCSVVKIVMLNSLTKKETSLEVIIRISMFLTNGLFGENFRMSDEEVLELIFENRELRPLWEAISSIGKFSIQIDF